MRNEKQRTGFEGAKKGHLDNATITKGAERATRELINATAWWDHVTEWHNPTGNTTFIGISAKHYLPACCPVAIKAAKVVKAKKATGKRKR